jgi:hypothetical protein
MSCVSGNCGGSNSEKKATPPPTKYVYIAEAHCDPHANDVENYRGDWHATHIDYNGKIALPKNCIRAKAGENGFVEMIVYKNNEPVIIDVDGKKRPKVRKLSGRVKLQALNNHKLCMNCVDAAKGMSWWIS